MNAPIFKPSEGFAAWLARSGGSLVFTARRMGKLFTIGVDDEGNLSFFERSFPEPRGLSVEGSSLFMADHFRIWRFENALMPGMAHPYDGYDAVYVPQMMYRTGNHDSHEVGLLKNGVIAFASTRMNCIGGCTATHAMVPLWKPPFIKSIVYEDRCHLNGLCFADGAVKFATALSDTDSLEGWRDVRATGGILIDVTANKVVARNLSMPHSPRLHQGELWLTNSGTGEVGTVNLETGVFTAKAEVPGFARGLTFVGDHAITATSKFRESESFQALPLEQKLKDAGKSDTCGLHVLNTRTGAVEHCLEIETLIEEIYDVAFIPGVRRMMLGGLNDDLSASLITLAPIRSS